MIECIGKYTKAKIMIDHTDEATMSQIIRMINNESFTEPVSIMPDCHCGTGSVIGFTMKIGNKIIPNIVGVDIGCGMLSVNIGDVELNHSELDKKIRENIPFGTNIRNKEHEMSDLITGPFYKKIYKKIGIDEKYAINSIGTLGGGKMIASRP